MNQLLPYELELNQQWTDCPLPDENMAWADMKRRLEEDDNKPMLPFWLRGCAGWLLLGLFVTGLGWWIVRPEKWFYKKQQDQEIKTNSATPVLNNSDTAHLDDSSAIVNTVPPVTGKDSNSVLINPGETGSQKKNEQAKQELKQQQQVITGTNQPIDKTGKQKADIAIAPETKSRKKIPVINQQRKREKRNNNLMKDPQDSTGKNIIPK
ncbi:MAG TPA: hypothetical protein VGO58_01445, partial [Chitinophagaceae bacterium]|nr:hypothetical protein [Chitinophagaceae bacterium]